MERKLSEFNEFEHDGVSIKTDLGSAMFDSEEEVVRIEGRIVDSEHRQVEIAVRPEDSADFNVSAAASDGYLSGNDLEEFSGELVEVVDVETGESI